MFYFLIFLIEFKSITGSQSTSITDLSEVDLWIFLIIAAVQTNEFETLVITLVFCSGGTSEKQEASDPFTIIFAYEKQLRF